MIKGRDLIVSINNTPIAAAKSCSLEMSTDFIEVASPMSGAWKEYIPTCNTWGCSADMLCAKTDDFQTLEQTWHDRQKVTLRFFDTTLGCHYTGSAYIQKLSLTGEVRGLVSASISFQACGELKRGMTWYTLTPILNATQPSQSEDGFEYYECGLNGLYIAKKVGDTYIRIDNDGREFELSNSVDDDGYTRDNIFKGGESAYYLVSYSTATKSGHIIYNPRMVYEFASPILTQARDAWFRLSCSVYCTDYDLSERGYGYDEVTVSDIQISRYQI